MIVEGRNDGWLRLPVETLPTWAVFNSVVFDGIRVGPIPGYEDRGSTVVAKRSLDRGHEAPLMTVPRHLILSLERVQEHAKVDGDFRAIIEGLGDFGRVGRLTLVVLVSFLFLIFFCPFLLRPLCSHVSQELGPSADLESDGSWRHLVVSVDAMLDSLSSDG